MNRLNSFSLTNTINLHHLTPHIIIIMFSSNTAVASRPSGTKVCRYNCSGGFRGVRGCGRTPLGVLQKNSWSTNFENSEDSRQHDYYYYQFYLAASSHEIFLRVGGKEGMKGLGALQRHQLPHPPCKNPGSATVVRHIISDPEIPLRVRLFFFLNSPFYRPRNSVPISSVIFQSALSLATSTVTFGSCIFRRPRKITGAVAS